MARRISGSRLAVGAVLSAFVLAAASSAAPLVQLSFDDENIETGPDTFQVFRNGKGDVRLTSDYRWSGSRSAEFRDVPGNHDFPELLVFLPKGGSGRIWFHFALMTPSPKEAFQVAAVGPRLYTLARDGFGFWLRCEDGMLTHTSDSIPKKLFAPEAFTWYVFDVLYDTEGGTYDLTVHREHSDEPLVELKRQANATRHRGSTIDRISFVSDPFEDLSRSVFYVDDVFADREKRPELIPFAAPGRRKLFLAQWSDYQRALRGGARCLPMRDLSEAALGGRDVALLKREGLLGVLQKAGSGRPIEPGEWDRVPSSLATRLRALNDWSGGCSLLAAGNPGGALSRFSAAQDAAPEARIYALSRLLALIGLRRWEEVNALFESLEAEWADDPRYLAAFATAAIAGGDFESAEAWLRSAASEAGAAGGDRDVLEQLDHRFPRRWDSATGDALLKEQFFFVLLWKNDFAAAREYAERLRRASETAGLPAPRWIERAGDAAAFQGDLDSALGLYRESLSTQSNSWVLLKLSDVCFLRGDLEGERTYREKIYGSLAPGP